MANITIIAPTLTRAGLVHGELMWHEARINLDVAAYTPVRHAETEFELDGTQAKDLVCNLIVMADRLNAINRSLLVNKKDATLEEFEAYLKLELKLRLELTLRTGEEVFNWEGSSTAVFKGKQYTLIKKVGDDYKFLSN